MKRILSILLILSFSSGSLAFLLKYTSDNLTFFHGRFSRDFDKKILPWWCTCSNEIIGVENESECHCEGKELRKLPQVLKNISILSVSNANLEALKSEDLDHYCETLKDLFITSVPIFSVIDPTAFRNVPHLRTIYISHAPSLLYIPSGVFRYITDSFKVLRIIQSGLKAIPDMLLLPSVGILSQIDFEGNEIVEIAENSFQVRTESLILDNNNLVSIKRAAFNGSEIGHLSMKGNRNLHHLDENAFEGILDIRELDLSRTAITHLPSNGLTHLERLWIQNTHTLIKIPSVYILNNLEEAHLTHPFHCCAFQFPSVHDPQTHEKHLQILKQLQVECDGSKNQTRKRKKRFNEVEIDKRDLDHFLSMDDDDEGSFHAPINTSFEHEFLCGNITFNVRKVKCLPSPDALNPCEDVMGSEWLRISVWIVLSLAVIGNTSVLIVLLSDCSIFTVPKFLMCNLAFADLAMGLYLMLVATVDLHSTGDYFNIAYHWQYGSGCRLAGFLTVFASQLSIFTLTIITIERWFAITKAIFLTKRLNRRNATIIMVFGYIFSIILASLPLLGVSNYSSTSICLPMRAEFMRDVIYLLTLLAASGIGFTIMVVCYLHIYLHLHMIDVAQGSAFNRETAATKKMALLVFTNFICWAPIAFFGLSALAGHSFIDVTQGKILLVFIYPLNSCANPYLYAIFTKQYHREAIALFNKCGCGKSQQQGEKFQFRHTTTNCCSVNATHTTSMHRLSSKSSKCSKEEKRLKCGMGMEDV